MFEFIVYEDIDGNRYFEDPDGNLQVEDPELHWLNKFSPDGKIIGFLDPVTKEFIEATDPKEIKLWNKWFQNWKERNKHIKKEHIF